MLAHRVTVFERTPNMEATSGEVSGGSRRSECSLSLPTDTMIPQKVSTYTESRILL